MVVEADGGVVTEMDVLFRLACSAAAVVYLASSSNT